jgi:hypothetical protein
MTATVAGQTESALLVDGEPTPALARRSEAERIGDLEITMHERPIETKPSDDKWSHFYIATDDALDYVQDLEDSLTIRVGKRSFPAHRRSTFSDAYTRADERPYSG